MFLAFLLVMILVGQQCFYLVDPINLTVGLAMGKTVLIGGEVAINFAKLFSWKVQSNF